MQILTTLALFVVTAIAELGGGGDVERLAGMPTGADDHEPAHDRAGSGSSVRARGSSAG